MGDDAVPTDVCELPVRKRLMGPGQFSLTSLMEYTTWCAVLSACAGLIGLVASGFLMAMGMALVIGQGMLALVMLMAASIFADNTGGLFGSKVDVGPVGRQLLVMILAALICIWYRWRRRRWIEG